MTNNRRKELIENLDNLMQFELDGLSYRLVNSTKCIKEIIEVLKEILQEE